MDTDTQVTRVGRLAGCQGGRGAWNHRSFNKIMFADEGEGTTKSEKQTRVVVPPHLPPPRESPRRLLAEPTASRSH